MNLDPLAAGKLNVDRLDAQGVLWLTKELKELLPKVNVDSMLLKIDWPNFHYETFILSPIHETQKEVGTED